ncbi:MAG: YtxH domain-containing protein [Gemmatimonadetes bacterium]|nr:YtxH domain-containing protein [Gemmatimonadota bacterium]
MSAMVDEEDLEPEAKPDNEDEEAEEPLDGGGRSGTLGFIAGLVLGALVGAGVALLMAPDRGVVTRKRLTRLARKVRDDARHHLDSWRDDVRRELSRRRRRLRERVER